MYDYSQSTASQEAPGALRGSETLASVAMKGGRTTIAVHPPMRKNVPGVIQRHQDT